MSSLKPNEPFFTRYRLIRRIGVGGYSEVWLANDTLAGNMQVALKIFAPDKGLDEQGVALFSKEYALVFNLNHPNLLLPKHFDVADGSPFLVLPYCEAGSVFSKIGMMSETDLAWFLQQAASALAHLHSQEPPIIHQDIKPDNFLIDNQGNYLLSDFGISSKIRRTLTRSMGAQGSAGTMAYMPPEKFSADKQVIKAGDIFSLGVTLYELLTGDLPFGDNGGLTLKAGADVPNLPAGYSPELKELLKRCMAKEPWERPRAEDLAEMAGIYLKNEKWKFEKDIKKAEQVAKEEVTTIMQDVDRSHVEQIEPEKPQAHSRTTQPIPPTPESLEKTKTQPKKHGSIVIIFVTLLLLPLFIALIFTVTKNQRILRSVDYKVFNVNGVTFDMAYIKGGTFLMGSNDGYENEKPVHRVTVSDFYMGKTEVTQKLWKAVMGASASLSNPSWFKGEDLPVERVNWDDAQEFILKLNQLTGIDFRLPTEAEWEYAAGGGASNRTEWAGTNSERKMGSYAWYRDNSNNQTQPVGTKKPNSLGLYDMSGNVWEWCEDDWHDNYKDAPIHGQARIDSTKQPIYDLTKAAPSSHVGWIDSRGSYRVSRGGSWDDDPSDCRAALRGLNTPDRRDGYLGFRVVLAP